MGLWDKFNELFDVVFAKVLRINDYKKEMQTYDDKTLMKCLKSKVMEERVAAACLLESRGYDVDKIRGLR